MSKRPLDARLLRLCADLHACQRRIEGLTSRDEDYDDEMTAWCRLFDRISAIPAKTREGLWAKASVFELELNLSRVNGKLQDAPRNWPGRSCRTFWGGRPHEA